MPPAAIRPVILENSRKGRSHYRLTVLQSAPASTFLARSTGLPKLRVKEAMIKGAVWLKRPGQKEKRIRRATFELVSEDRIDLYYDLDILATQPLPPRLIAEEQHYSIWFKPANLLTQGTRYGDHCSLLRSVEIHYLRKRKIYPVHRLDREAFGLVIVAHSGQGAAAFSELFRQGQVEKRYRALVYGRFSDTSEPRRIAQPIDGKEAVTVATMIAFSPADNTSTVDIRLHTGRFHQIRRHLSWIGHPVVGDPKYGINGKPSGSSLQLCAYGLQFRCPFSGANRRFEIEVPGQPVLPPMTRNLDRQGDTTARNPVVPESHEPNDGDVPSLSREQS